MRLKGSDLSCELIGFYDVIARLMSLALQHGAPLEKVVDLLAGAKFAPCSPLSGHARIKHCSSLPDLTSRHLLVKCGGPHELIMFRLQQSWIAHHDFGNTMLIKYNPSSGETGVPTNADSEECAKYLGIREIRPPRSSDQTMMSFMMMTMVVNGGSLFSTNQRLAVPRRRCRRH